MGSLEAHILFFDHLDSGEPLWLAWDDDLSITGRFLLYKNNRDAYTFIQTTQVDNIIGLVGEGWGTQRLFSVKYLNGETDIA